MNNITLNDKQAAALQQGKAFQKAVQMMKNIVNTSAQIETDEYIITLAAEEAEGLYTPSAPDHLNWQIPQPQDNLHLEIIIQDKQDLRFIPELNVECELQTNEGNSLGKHPQPFLWHPLLYHYGLNWHIPKSGTYSVIVTIQPAQFPRHDQNKGHKYQHQTTVKFTQLKFQPGRKEYGPE